ncbi:MULTISPECIES: tRNA lysidine(34) synthetase TilS [Photorhabdus]|uniref:tRNA(Ile)-lysidine synthase n=1 Tax=Photorhabdus thracensis TaxID=230089 RepID=A0A0F7LLL4_9GAMM|nr:tRNA lysidine(34) synthetase TilS [Photorhabdus thracensis]AKH62682.1 tRNA(Ile)-lysidine ligase [Photorhabdus thracensis]MCC8420493.1 tRNA lysidine(34) synthetase TilS [Photorhabdus thracensis]
MTKIDERLFFTLAKQFGEHKKILVGFSGGLDSSVLLHLLVDWRNQHNQEVQLRAMHIHHGLNPKADQWVEYCQQICDDWQVEFCFERVTIDAREKGIEAAARDARYQMFECELQKDEILVTAQHLDDQAETFLLALKRGSGPAGLASMPPVAEFADTLLFRPLLGYSRSELEIYASEHRLSWIEDDSNQDDRYDRNFLRLHVMPLLNQRWPHFPQSVARSASLCGEQEQLLDELLNESLKELVTQDGALGISPLEVCSEAKRNALLRRWFSYHDMKMPSREQLHRLWYEVALARTDAEPQLQFGQYNVRRYKQKLWLVPQLQSLRDTILEWDICNPLVLPDRLGELNISDRGIQVRAPANNERVTIRFGVQGMMSIVGRQHSRHSKKLWQEFGVAPWLRERIPLLYYNEQLIAALGIFITKESEAAEGQRILTINWNKTLLK